MERFRGCLLGLACGDAVGTTVEFKPRFSAHNDDEAHPPQGMRPPYPSFWSEPALILGNRHQVRGEFCTDDNS